MVLGTRLRDKIVEVSSRDEVNLVNSNSLTSDLVEKDKGIVEAPVFERVPL
jgi:hypothetical protein